MPPALAEQLLSVPITIHDPLVGQPFGPGFWFHVSSDFIGPIEPGTYFRLQLVDPTSELVVDDGAWSTLPLDFATTFMTNLGGTPQLSPLRSAVGVDGPINLVVTLNSPTAELEREVVSVEYEPTAGAHYVLWEQTERILFNQTPAAAQLDTIEQAVHMAWPGSSLLQPISELLTHPARGLLGRELITPDRTGSGSLTRPGLGLQVNAFGVAWDVISAPAGIGVDAGAPSTWTLAILKLALVHTDKSGDLYISSHGVFNLTDTWWMFDPALPTRLDYWILPGVVVRFYWLVF